MNLKKDYEAEKKRLKAKPQFGSAPKTVVIPFKHYEEMSFLEKECLTHREVKSSIKPSAEKPSTSGINTNKKVR